MNFDNIFAKRQFVSVFTHNNCDQWFTLIKRWLTDKELYYVIKILIFFLDTFASNSFSFFTDSSFTFKKIDVKTLYWLNIYISTNDQKYVSDKSTVKNVWISLKFKYKKKLQITKKQYLTEYVEYWMSIKTFIDKTWTHLIKLDRKIAAIQSDLSDFIKFDCYFQTLLQSLSKKYTVIYDAINAQNIFNVKWDLQKL